MVNLVLNSPGSHSDGNTNDCHGALRSYIPDCEVDRTNDYNMITRQSIIAFTGQLLSRPEEVVRRIRI